MKIIKSLSEMIYDELDGACEYIDKAIEYKQDHPQLADALAKLSNEEMGHMKILHDHVTALIEQERKEHGEPPVAMMAVYEYIHEKQMKKAAEIKAKQAVYREIT